MSRDSGSFRDPSGYVFQFEGRVFRALDRASAELLRGRPITAGTRLA